MIAARTAADGDVTGLMQHGCRMPESELHKS
jgi:hypothetical protein